MTVAEQVAAVVAAADFGEPTARKTGRNPAWPYVPVIIWPGGLHAAGLGRGGKIRSWTLDALDWLDLRPA